MHPSERIKGEKSKKLWNKKIIFGITGGIAAVECVKIARELIRHGADVYPVMTKDACNILHPQAMKFATGNDVIIELTGNVEHVSYEADLLLIAPCTANTISKIANGIADNALTTFALAFENKIIIAPSMHEKMFKNKFLEENIKKCNEKGIKFIPPKIEEGKAKMASNEEIIEAVIRELRGKDKEGKKVLVIGGPTSEPIDDVRVLTNISSGKMARAIAIEVYERGADVETWFSSIESFSFIPNRSFSAIKDLINLIKKAKKYDAVINCAAISDFIVKKRKGKIESKEKVVVCLEPSPRINPMLKKIGKIVIGFKLEEKNVFERAYKRMRGDGIDYMIGNKIDSIGKDYTQIWIIGKEGLIKKVKGRKEEVAKNIVDLI
ncbi:MAG: bifunctional phosphopantothenoylcysteine decarboxylase/phosphopantothenate--cysteine ligase CoaBC [Thermoplasmatales archaeon]|nr:bifunctional phosphopantothenoylcysteine decarboxylase/phosphopantothenate--cysteine ligase CoaBC [Thermoplasmatales archaeon]